MLQEQELLDCYQALERPLFNVLYRMLWQQQECQDVLQEAFLKVWQQRETLQAPTLAAYIYTTALNLAKNRVRWRFNWVFEQLDPWLEQWSGMDSTNNMTDSPEVQLQYKQQQQLLRRALAALPQLEREVLLLTEYSELTLAQTAQVLTIPAGTVASRRNRALKILQQQVEQLTGRGSADAD